MIGQGHVRAGQTMGEYIAKSGIVRKFDSGDVVTLRSDNKALIIQP